MKGFNYPSIPDHCYSSFTLIGQLAYTALDCGRINDAISMLEELHSTLFTWTGRLTKEQSKFENRMTLKIIRIELASMRNLLITPKKDQSTPLDSDPALS